MRGPDSTERFAYDTDGQLTQHARHIDGHEFTTAYVYNDITGKLTEKDLPDGQILNYHHHANGKLRAVTRDEFIGRTTLVGELNTKANSLTHERRVHGNGIATGYDYDNTGRLTRLTTTRVQQLKYRYDKQGNITDIERDFEFERYGYDALGRLTEAETPVGSFQYQYDKLGNRIGKTENGQTTDYTYSADGQGNRLDNVSSEEEGGAETLTYNKSGSPIQSGDRSYDYNAEQRPIKLYIDGTLKAEYSYNGWGERIKKVVHAGDEKAVTYYFYDEQTLTGEANQNGKVTAQYVYYKSQPVAKLEGSELYAIHTDHLGTPHAATDGDGGLVWAADYTPFGKATATTQQITLNLRFPGQYEDEESGTHYNYYRYYNPQTGRYITSDPIGLNGGLNTYAYVGGSPLIQIDPLGLAGCFVLYPDYPITYAPGPTSTRLGGHAGVLGYNESGSTRYFEYGRYSPNGPGIVGEGLPSDQGNVRRVTIPDLEIGSDGNPTPESTQRLQDALSQRAGRGTRAELTCDVNADEDRIYDHVNGIANDTNRAPYSWYPWSANHCRTFARDALGAGQ